MATYSTELKNEALDAMLANLNGGLARIYTGSAPAAPTDAATGTLLAEITLGNPAFAAASGGSATSTASTAEDSALASGTAGYCRLTKTDGTTGAIDLVVGGSQRVTASNSGGNLLSTSATAHGHAQDAPVRFFVEAGGVLPTGIDADTTYYISATGLSATTFCVSTSAGGGVVAYTDTGTNHFRVKAAATEVALASKDASISEGVEVSISGFTVTFAG